MKQSDIHHAYATGTHRLRFQRRRDGSPSHQWDRFDRQDGHRDGWLFGNWHRDRSRLPLGRCENHRARAGHAAKQNLPDLPGVTLDTIDLLDPASNDAFAKRFLDENDTLHILVNNARVMAPPFDDATKDLFDIMA
jgi:NAD(P)-dependent dehydrogenase (short-subunit alcohol dehydrogenase family)